MPIDSAPPVRSAPRPPVRIVHLGLGAFHRAHQAWYTAVSEPDWGIAAFTGRSPEAADLLNAQDCVYTLIERSETADHRHPIESIVEAHDGNDHQALRRLLRRPEVAVVTLTVTEKGYHRSADGRLDADDPDVIADAAALGHGLAPAEGIHLRTVPARLLCALHDRHLSRAGTIALVPCDNVADNSEALRAVLHDLARLAGAGSGWLDDTVDMISTSVDRITPRITADDMAPIALTLGYHDATPVITEPFSSWVLSGTFRGSRPSWDRGGAQWVDDIVPFERRKLWMLNGAHSLLAYLGILRGHETIAQAVTDPVCRERMHALWDLGERHLARHPELRIAEYRGDLEARFANSAIVHPLRQIAADGTAKLRNRVVELIALERDAGGTAGAALGVIAAWARFVIEEAQSGRDVDDVDLPNIKAALSSGDPVRALIARVSPELAAQDDIVQRVQD